MLQYAVKSDRHETTVSLRKEGSSWIATIDDKDVVVDVIRIDAHEAVFEIGKRILRVGFNARGSQVEVSVGGDVHQLVAENQLEVAERNMRQGAAGGDSVIANMPGKVVAVSVKVGDAVKQGQGLVVLEAMKMENELKAPRDGIVKSVKTKAGTTVEQNTVLIELEKEGT